MNTDVIKYEYGVIVARIRISCFFQFKIDKNNLMIDLYLIVSQLYNDIIHNIFKLNHKKIHVTTLLVILVE
jgi:hypothetical protein